MQSVGSGSDTGKEKAELCQDRLGEAITKGDRKQAGLPAADLAGSTARSIQIWMKTHQGVIKCQKAELEERGCN